MSNIVPYVFNVSLIVDEGAFDRDENKVKGGGAYFTKEKIDELTKNILEW